MDIEIREADGVSVVHPGTRRLEAAVAAEFKEKMRTFISRGGKSFVLDLSGVDFIDSSGLAALLHCIKQVGPEGKMILGGVTGTLRELFSITRLDQSVFTIHGDVDDAVADLKG